MPLGTGGNHPVSAAPLGFIKGTICPSHQGPGIPILAAPLPYPQAAGDPEEPLHQRSALPFQGGPEPFRQLQGPRQLRFREHDQEFLAADAAGQICAPQVLAHQLAEVVREVTKLRGEVQMVPPGTLPNDGKVIEDARSYK